MPSFGMVWNSGRVRLGDVRFGTLVGTGHA